jgi:hypothetical protein
MRSAKARMPSTSSSSTASVAIDLRASVPRADRQLCGCSGRSIDSEYRNASSSRVEFLLNRLDAALLLPGSLVRFRTRLLLNVEDAFLHRRLSSSRGLLERFHPANEFCFGGG